MKKILLVSGCSFTDSYFDTDIHPDMICDWPRWPELVADELNMQCVNLALGGSGNERIYSTLSDYLTTHPLAEKENSTFASNNKKGGVIANLSLTQPSLSDRTTTTFVSRQHLIDKEYEFTMPKKLSHIGLVVAAWTRSQRRDWSIRTQVKRADKRDNWFSNLHAGGSGGKGDPCYWILKSVRYQYAYQNLCKQLKLPYCQFQMLPLSTNKSPLYGNIKNMNLHSEVVSTTGYNELMDKHYFKWSNTKYGKRTWSLNDCLEKEERISDTDYHPNKKGHEKLANEFLKHLHENKIL